MSSLLSIYNLYIEMWKQFVDIKGVFRIPKSKDRQNNGQKKKYKRTSKDLQTYT